MKNPKLKIKTQFKESFAYLKESKNYIYVAIFIFVFGALFGFIFQKNLTFINDIIKELMLKTIDLNPLELTFFILQNNLQSALLAVLLGVAFGIFPIFNALANGTVIGYVMALTYDVAGLSSWWRLLPHGIFELPAIFISLGLGIKLGFTIFTERSKRGKEFKKRFYQSLNAFLMIVIPLLIIAAIIEGILISLIQ